MEFRRLPCYLSVGVCFDRGNVSIRTIPAQVSTFRQNLIDESYESVLTTGSSRSNFETLFQNKIHMHFALICSYTRNLSSLSERLNCSIRSCSEKLSIIFRIRKICVFNGLIILDIFYRIACFFFSFEIS